jgi:putative acetyltransferase
MPGIRYSKLEKRKEDTIMIEIREEREQDREVIGQVNEKAFCQSVEANIVDALRANCPGLLSLVALSDGSIVGHILFSPVVIECGDTSVTGMGLAPMAVLQEHQRRGIGSALVRTGLARLRDRQCPFVVVLGHTEYYPRFGFERASLYSIFCQWDGVPDEAFMVHILDLAAMAVISGVARFRSELDAAV